MGNRDCALKVRLDELCSRYDSAFGLTLDPLSIPLSYADPLDQELAAFLAASLAYGRVEPMIRAIGKAMLPLGPRPSQWLRDESELRIQRLYRRDLGPWVWRFHTAEDVLAWLLAWKRLDAESGHGLEDHLRPSAKRSGEQALSVLVQRLRQELPTSQGLRFSLPDPLEGAACKRWRMFLRWMVRTRWPDLGLWKRYPTDQLIIPLDTHVARVSKFIGLTDRGTPDGKMAQQITAALRRLDPQDPLRYDFAISHLGILGDCPGLRRRSTCSGCPLYSVCRAGFESAARVRR
jgi:uncharacterized protein (TIGR02757 family)